jgi:uncharacterized membrane protein
MHRDTRLLTATAFGAGLSYFMDPRSGRRRRVLARDRLNRLLHEAADVIQRGVQDALHRFKGFAWEGKRLVFAGRVDDEVLVERVHAALGRVVRHPGSINVRVEEGRVTLTGPVLADEAGRLLRRLLMLKGLKSVENQLKIYDRPGDVPGIQGNVPARHETAELAQESWTPALRLVAGAAGVWAVESGVRRAGVFGSLLGAAGSALLVRSAVNKPFKRIAGVGAGRRAIELQKVLHVNAPVEEVFTLWTQYENFPRFMSHVREVRATDPKEGRSLWIVEGPAGVPVRWEAVLTDIVANKLIAWKTVPGAFIQHAGLVRFDSDAGGGTRVNIRLSYNPGLGLAAHAVAKILGVDPKRQMDEDLARMKTFLEQGKPPHDAARKPSKEEP